MLRPPWSPPSPTASARRRSRQAAGPGALSPTRTSLIVAATTLAGVAYALLLGWRFGFPVDVSPLFQVELIGGGALCAGTLLFLLSLLRERSGDPIAHLKVFAKDLDLKTRAIAAVPPLLCMSVFIVVFGSVKSAIPTITDYTWDPFLADMDEALFGGRAAWQVLQPILGHPLVSSVLNLAYHAWLVAFYMAAFVLAIWIERPALRAQFFVAVVLACWLLGSVVSVLLPSVGPCFYADFYGSDRFAGLTSYLHHADTVAGLPALQVQKLLLSWHNAGVHGYGAGISAMPSMHVSIAVLLASAGWSVSRAWGAAGTLFATLIVLGSIHLGYHYAVDGIASILATPLLWWLAGWIVARGERRVVADLQPAQAVP